MFYSLCIHILYDCLFAGAKILVSFQIHFVSCNRYFAVNNKLCKNESSRPLTIVLLNKYLFRFIHFYTSYIIIIGGDNFFIVHILLNSRIRLFHVPFLVPIHAGIAAALFKEFVLLGILEARSYL